MNITRAVMMLCCWVAWGTVSAGDDALQEMDTALEQAKRDMLDLDEKIRRLAHSEKHQALETLSVYVSIDSDLAFRLEKVQLKLNGKTVTEPAFYRPHWQALKQGGAACVYRGGLAQGKYRLEAIFSGREKGGRRAEYREQWNLTLRPGRNSLIELHLGNAIFSQAPAIDMRVVD